MILYFIIIILGLVITLGVTALYGIFAPWYRSDTGKSFFILLSALSLILLNSAIRLFFARAEWTAILGIILFLLYCAAMVVVGWHIYKAQIGNYLERKKAKQDETVN